MPDFKVPEAIPAAISVKDFLRHHAGISLTVWRKIKHTGSIAVNNHPVVNYALVKPGDIITVTWKQDCAIPATPLPLQISYEDDSMLIIDKPAGILVHPTKITDTDTLANAVMFYYQQCGFSYGFHPVHRLDRNTSGLVLIAKSPHIQYLLSRDNVKALQRVYQAVVSGSPEPSAGMINLPIGRAPNSIIQRMVRSDGQKAITSYHVIKSFTAASLIELELFTGRTHQIRAHLSYIGHPLLGDDLYGGSNQLICRQALHAAQLSFTHPLTHEAIRIRSPLPNDMSRLLYQLSTGTI
ncbi:MAG: RluA family pseudouridine synthase [Veillonellales bacterium]